MALHVVNEARRCLNCKKPRCREGCPLGGRDGLALPRREALWRAGCRGGGSSSARELMSINS